MERVQLDPVDLQVTLRAAMASNKAMASTLDDAVVQFVAEVALLSLIASSSCKNGNIIIQYKIN